MSNEYIDRMELETARKRIAELKSEIEVLTEKNRSLSNHYDTLESNFDAEEHRCERLQRQVMNIEERGANCLYIPGLINRLQLGHDLECALIECAEADAELGTALRIAIETGKAIQ